MKKNKSLIFINLKNKLYFQLTKKIKDAMIVGKNILLMFQ